MQYIVGCRGEVVHFEPGFGLRVQRLGISGSQVTCDRKGLKSYSIQAKGGGMHALRLGGLRSEGRSFRVRRPMQALPVKLQSLEENGYRAVRQQ